MDALPLLAGLGFFMLGMKQLELSLAALAGIPFRRFLRSHADTPIKGIAAGTVITAVLQSSSLVSLLVLAFVGAGVIQLGSAIGVILGANLGTTVTGWLVATLGFKFNLAAYALGFIGVGGIAQAMLSKTSSLRDAAGFVVGLGLLLFGLTLMKDGVEQFSANLDVSPFAGLPAPVLVLIGIGVTAVIQSSSATMMIAISALHGGVLTLEAAAALAIGTGVGTTVTAVIGALGGSADKKRVAAAHVGFNVMKASIALLLLHPLLGALSMIPALANQPLLMLVAFHSSFNIIGILLALPIIKPAARWLGGRFVSDDGSVSRYIQSTDPTVPEAGIVAVRKEVRRGIGMAMALNRVALGIASPGASRWREADKSEKSNGRRDYLQRYEQLKRLEGELAEYVGTLQSHEIPFNLGRELVAHLEAMRLAVISAKCVKDVRQNVSDLRLAMRPELDVWVDRLVSRIEQLDRQLEELDPAMTPPLLIETLSELRAGVRQERDAVVTALYQAASARTLSELELSTLFNVNRELHSSAKAMLRALGSHLLAPETFSAVEAANN